MGILSRAVFREVATAALLGTSLFTFVLFLQSLGRLFEVLVRGSASTETVLWLLACLIPPALIFSLPVGTLVGVLIGLGRMSADNEVIAMRAAGVPSRRVVAPVLVFAAVMMGVAAGSSLYLTPRAIEKSYDLLSTSVAAQITAQIQPRVFEEQFTNSNKILYVRDVVPTTNGVALWRGVFIADTTPAEERSNEARQLGESPRITIATEALAVPDAARNTIQLSMRGVSSHEVDVDPSVYYNTKAPEQDQVLMAKSRDAAAVKPYVSMPTEKLYEYAKQDRDAALQLHRRFALPVACLLLALVGIPLGVSSRKGGKSAAFVVTVFIAFLYWTMLISLIGLAEQNRLGVELAAWLPNAVFAVLGLLLVWGLDRPGDRDVLSRLNALIDRMVAAVRAWLPASSRGGFSLPRLPLMPGIVDTYVLSSFLFYFGLWLGSFVLFEHVFIFFDLLGDVFERHIPMSKVAQYHFFLTPKLLYDSAPFAVLVAVLVTFGMLSKNNEVTAMKACGVSLYRLSAPILVASSVLSVLLFAFDHYYIPKANRIQDSILDEIKGRPAQTYLRPDRKWIFGRGSRIYYYKYMDPQERIMLGVNVYDLNPRTFALERHISADTARWEPTLNNWVFQNGWSRRFDGYKSTFYEPYLATSFPDLNEPLTHFLQEARQEKQLNFAELETYIRELQQSGLDTVRLRVQFHKKFSLPLFALIMGLIAVPFAFLTGNRGAMAGIGVSFGVAIAYFAAGRLFEEVGNVNQLPAVLAAWSPNALFSMAGMYLYSRMRT